MNNSNKFVFLLFLLLEGISIQVISGKGGKDDHDREKASYWEECLGQRLESAAVKRANDSCVTELKFEADKSVKEIAKNKCFRVCQLQKFGFLGTDNVTLNTAGIATFVDATFPAAARDGIKSGIAACSATVVAGTTASENCQKYKPLLECIDRPLKKNCKGTNAANPSPTAAGVTRVPGVISTTTMRSQVTSTSPRS